ncbi:DUF4268 domain-containing protein [Paludibacter sp. 221]|uniref:DUF4268 domain-containing protein n=1 Tax=Paludibacter sp. 221 TaxID=2302939 RepID=UPI0013CFDCC9|nr:DUF4268 domain-containing protein [Paludibacter sp. 221]NDV46760.1 DUF4268 domain-containing protein [Paludibacter sp. 221]
MYTKDELKELKKEFWEGYGNFCRNLPGMEHRKDKFLLNTKMKGVEFKYDATREGAFVILEINNKDENERLNKYEQFEKYKAILEADFPEGLIWNFAYRRECGNEVCRIYSFKPGLDIHRRTDWLAFFRFMSAEMLKLEEAFLDIKDAIR